MGSTHDRTRSSWSRTVMVIAGAAVMLGGGIAFAAIPAPDGTITACVKGRSEYFPQSGVCKRGWQALKWNAVGPGGAPGAPGAQGAPGQEGPEGPPGPGELHWATLTPGPIEDGFATHTSVSSDNDVETGYLLGVYLVRFPQIADLAQCSVTASPHIENILTRVHVAIEVDSAEGNVFVRPSNADDGTIEVVPVSVQVAC